MSKFIYTNCTVLLLVVHSINKLLFSPQSKRIDFYLQVDYPKYRSYARRSQRTREQPQRARGIAIITVVVITHAGRSFGRARLERKSRSTAARRLLFVQLCVSLPVASARIGRVSSRWGAMRVCHSWDHLGHWVCVCVCCFRLIVAIVACAVRTTADTKKCYDN